MISALIKEEVYPGTERLTYQTALRALGAWLDVHHSESGIRIFETPDGFIVQRGTPLSTGDELSLTITFEQVWQLVDDKKYRKRSKERDGGYQNALRAVGFELDRAEAHNMLLEQIGDELLLTYVYARYQGGFSVVKHFSVLGPEARDDLMRAAQGRRKPGKIAQGLSRLIAQD